MKLRRFNEAEEYIYSNPAFPGENGKREGEEDYLNNALNRRKQQINQQGSGSFDIGTVQNITNGKEPELEALANLIITDLYKGLIERYQIIFDIKFSNSREMGNMLEINENIELEKYKRKIINLLGQGESKNMMHIIHSEEVKNGVYEIFGEEIGQDLIKAWINIVKAVDLIDMNRSVNNFNAAYVKNTIGGVVKVEWAKKDNLNEATDEDEFFEEEEDENWDENLLNALNENDEETVDAIIKEKELPENYIKGHYRPKIVVRGIDFTLLIHESIKGLYTTLAMGGIPKDKEIAREVLNKGNAIKEEPEEFKHGPMFAADMRDFLNESQYINTYPNLREEFWIKVVKLPAADFLELIRGILSKKQEARIQVDIILKEVIKEIKRFKSHKENQEKIKRNAEKRREYEESLRLWNEKNPQEDKEEEEQIDYSKLTQKQLHDLQNDAIDNEDWTTAQNIAQYINDK